MTVQGPCWPLLNSPQSNGSKGEPLVGVEGAKPLAGFGAEPQRYRHCRRRGVRPFWIPMNP